MTMPNLKPTEMLLILLVVLLLFGAKRLPDLARSVGKSLNILKSEAKAASNDEASASTETPAVTSNPSAAAHALDDRPARSTLPADGYDTTHA